MAKKMIFHEDELDEFLITKLSLIEPTSPRAPENALRGRNEYVNKTKALDTKPVYSVAGLIDIKNWRMLFASKRSISLLTTTIMLFIGILFGSWGTAYAARDSLPNELLYAVKLAGENVQLIFAPDTEARITLLTTFTDRRVDEAVALALQGQPIPKTLPALMDTQLEELFTLATSMNNASIQEMVKGIQTHLRDQEKAMTDATNALSETPDPQFIKLQETIIEHQQLAQIALENSDGFQQQLQENQQVKPTTLITTLITDATSTTIPANITITLEVSGTRIITPGQNGASPCEIPGACTPPANEHNPGPSNPTPPAQDENEGDRPGSEQGQDHQKPPATPAPGEIDKPQQTQKPGPDENGKESNDGKGDKP